MRRARAKPPSANGGHCRGVGSRQRDQSGPHAEAGVAIQEQLRAAIDGRRGVDAADSLCDACVVHLDIDAAAISLVFDGAATGTLGCSSEAARRYDEMQFTFGEGPCLD